MTSIDIKELRGFDAERLQQAILKAFNPASFAQALFFKLDRRLDDISGSGPFKQRVFDVIMTALEEEWTGKLVLGLREANPGNSQLRQVAETFGMVEERTEPLPGGKSLERIVREDGGFSDVLLWTQGIADLQRRVCRVERPVNSAVGTGFLVGPDLLLTNHHVMANVIGDKAKASEIACRFDYAVGPAGASDGKSCALAADWHIASSPPSMADAKPDRGPASAQELDYCLVRLAALVGDDQDAQQKPRGWVPLVSKGVAPKEHDILLVLQHPEGLPVKLAIGAVLAPNENQTRLRHDANTKKGSSGSPCFDANLNLVGLHHSGDPFYDAPDKPKYNQAIPTGLIVGRLAEQGVAKFWSD